MVHLKAMFVYWSWFVMLTLLFQQNPPKKTHPPVEVENGSLEDQFYLPNGHFPLLWLLDKEYPLKSNILPFQRHFWVDICFSNSLLVGYAMLLSWRVCFMLVSLIQNPDSAPESIPIKTVRSNGGRQRRKCLGSNKRVFRQKNTSINKKNNPTNKIG